MAGGGCLDGGKVGMGDRTGLYVVFYTEPFELTDNIQQRTHHLVFRLDRF